MTDQRNIATGLRPVAADIDALSTGRHESHATTAEPVKSLKREAAPATSALESERALRRLAGTTIPLRYELRDSDDGRFLHCDEAPRVRVEIDRKLAFSEAEARALGGRRIFLDGAGTFGPLLDNKARVYNLDHHQGCVRPFTLATCEQALILVINGIEFDEGDWTIYANEPDLDTIFAIWVLLNFRRVPTLSPRSRDVLLPMLRYEGAIDSNGSEAGDYCGLPLHTLREARGRIASLYEREQSFRRGGRSSELDWRGYTADLLAEIDRLVYTRKDFEEYPSVEEVVGHIEIGERKVAVACRDEAGIYEAERNLKKRWGDQLGVIALEKALDRERFHYTLRRVSALSDFDLEPAYRVLNLLDRAVDGRPAGKRWGGSSDIGGSPRPSGTKIAPQELLRLLQLAYTPRKPYATLRQSLAATAVTSSLLLVATVTALATVTLADPRSGGWASASAGTVGLLAFSGAILALALPMIRNRTQRRWWLFGWRRPAGYDWFYAVPVVLVGALPAAWVPRGMPPELASLLPAAAAAVLAAFAVEVWFRGLVHGRLLFEGTVSHVKGPWLLSRATLVSALLYAGVTLLVSCSWTLADAEPFSQSPLRLALTLAGALAGGIALGVIRERSLSLWPGFVLQVAGGLAGAALLLGGIL
ncbi:MAG: hypothetical protein JRH19_25975 [Deltaproteobacteria bacterium]|nr:hypothetical protein [Deltaproteobacteria bacterium]